MRDNTRDLFATLKEAIRSWSDRAGHEDAYIRGSQARKDLAEQIRRYRAISGREEFIRKLRTGLAGDLRDSNPSCPSCPQCGEPLRTERAKQCVECGADWH